MGSAGLLALHSAMRLNTTLTNINLDEAIVNVSSSKVGEGLVGASFSLSSQHSPSHS